MGCVPAKYVAGNMGVRLLAFLCKYHTCSTISKRLYKYGGFYSSHHS